MKNKIIISMIIIVCLMCGCGKTSETTISDDKAEAVNNNGDGKESGKLTILAAASLTDVCSEIEKAFTTKYPEVELTFSLGSSGALQTQIEEGAPADVFFSAAMKQMDELDEKGYIAGGSVKKLLENKIVLVVPSGRETDIESFEDLTSDKVKMIGLGEPESVPAGRYAEEVLSSLNILDEVKQKANYGSDVRTVLSWVETGNVDCGVVYATDAYSTDRVKIIAEAPEGSCDRVIYPVGIVKSSENVYMAGKFTEYLAGDEAMDIFKKYGFSEAEE